MPAATPARDALVRAALAAACGALALLLLPPLRARQEPEQDGAGRDAAPLRYDRDVRPILAEHCFACHGRDASKREAELRLDERDSATADRGGYAAIAPGDPQASELWHRVTSEDLEERMPPAASGKKPLSTEERALVRRWIEEGAPYEPHWSFVPPVRPVLPEVETPGWCRNAVDRFVLARLEQSGLVPAEPADPETLLRRLFLDLTGLPPTPEESEAFLADARPDAYERWVERLLTEEPYVDRYAERMATPWLDAARYADTSGIHMDAGRQVWPWRDWVLAAYRDGMPFDQFLTEQLAGDLLPEATQAQRVASGFNRQHVTSDEGGAIDEEYRVEYAVDRTATTGTVFLGLTLGCARCHAHKFDPIEQEEFYRFYAYFDSIEEPGVYTQSPDANRALEPFLSVPTPDQEAERARLAGDLAASRQELDRPFPEDQALYEAFLAGLPERTGSAWAACDVASAVSEEGATLARQDDGSVLAGGTNPERDVHVLRLSTDAQDLRLVALEALADERLPLGRIGRAPNGNAVLSEITAEAISRADPTHRVPLHFVWAWADHAQADGDFGVANAIDGSDERGWAVDAHHVEGARHALFLADAPFGFAGGTELEVRLRYRSAYAQHALGRVRLALGTLDAPGLDLLPVASGGWQRVGPFPAPSGAEAFDTAFGPEEGPALELGRNFGFGNQYWAFDAGLADERANGELPKGTNATYVAKRLYAPSARRLELSLGSDDGLRVFLDGAEVFQHRVERSLAADQDRAVLELSAGVHALVLKIVNAGGDAGFFLHALPPEGELAGALVAALLPGREAPLERRVAEAWHLVFSPAYRALATRIRELEESQARLEATIPRTMVMKELATPRATFVLTRGQYDHPDPARAVERGVPAALGGVAGQEPRDRLELARWMTSSANPLVARVAVNRVWELVYGSGLVRTTEDFGARGDWPSHPELLDWLALEFREGGWDVKGLVRLLVTSSTYRQGSRPSALARERDPDGRLYSAFPRRRLSAEAIRDQALFVSGLLVERLGGPSVKPYQPDGLWQEVAMVQSNTREYVRGTGADLWRRSLYTYWKRACPPPALLAFDAPTREFCQVRRATTNTPLQALVLWNDVTFVEAARALAARTLDASGDDDERLALLVRRVLARRPDAGELASLERALSDLRARYRAAPEDAALLVAVGEAPRPALDPAELAAWTLVASALLSLDETLTRS